LDFSKTRVYATCLNRLPKRIVALKLNAQANRRGHENLKKAGGCPVTMDFEVKGFYASRQKCNTRIINTQEKQNKKYKQ
jgi:hypothetical protein